MDKTTPDITVPIAEGIFNLRVGAIILQDDKVLMVKNDRDPYYYSVGGRVKLHETLEAAVVREVLEETGATLAIDRLVWIHENFFTSTFGATCGKRYHEISFFYLMKPTAELRVTSGSYTNDGAKERLVWLSMDDLAQYELYPEVFKTGLRNLPQVPTPIVTIREPSALVK
ncbi:MAG: NUDIX hydrolase [Oscillospiraceae bacterium]|jgi:ADP-ribose pyrophosphatase YjhB (NUDIX family)|nr:NUDIX hydrolase [Oscillospiraceae bacterium]